MKNPTHFFSLLTICFMLLIVNTDAIAQKKPKLKGIAKELVGTWKLDDLSVFLTTTEDKLTEEQKQNYEMAKAMMPMIIPTIKGKVVYTFKPDGTYKKVEEGEEGEPKEIIGKWQLDKNKLKLTPENVSKENPAESAEITILKNVLNMKMTEAGEVIGADMKFLK